MGIDAYGGGKKTNHKHEFCLRNRDQISGLDADRWDGATREQERQPTHDPDQEVAFAEGTKDEETGRQSYEARQFQIGKNGTCRVPTAGKKYNHRDDKLIPCLVISRPTPPLMTFPAASRYFRHQDHRIELP